MIRDIVWKIDPKYEHIMPILIPMKYPPMSLLGADEYVFGIAKMMNEVAPRDAIRAVSVITFKNKSDMRIMLVARRH